MALLHVHFRSEVLGLQTAMDVLLPERPCTLPGGRWPALYLLHGLTGDHTDWQRRTSLERYWEGRDLAVVMPAVHRSFYTDMRQGGKYWTFVSQELPALAEGMLPLSPDRAGRFAAGLSMGGYGALKLGLRCPDRFAAVAALSGAVDLVALHAEGSREPDSFFTRIFGPMEAFRGGGDDLAAVARRLVESGGPLPRIYMACGTEDFLYENNRGFLAAFQKPLAIDYEEGPGDHTWEFWDAYLPRVLDWLGRAGGGS